MCVRVHMCGGGTQVGEPSALEKNLAADLGVLSALCPPDNMKYCLLDILPHPDSLPSPPHPSSGHWGRWNHNFLFFLFLFSVFWFYRSEGLETGKPTHSLDLSSLPGQTARQIRIGNLLSSLCPSPLPTQRNKNKPIVAVEAAAGTHWCIIERVNILFHLAWCWQRTSSWHYFM